MENTDKVGDASMTARAIPIHDENLSILQMKNGLDAKVRRYAF